MGFILLCNNQFAKYSCCIIVSLQKIFLELFYCQSRHRKRSITLRATAMKQFRYFWWFKQKIYFYKKYLTTFARLVYYRTYKPIRYGWCCSMLSVWTRRCLSTIGKCCTNIWQISNLSRMITSTLISISIIIVYEKNELRL